MIRKYLNMSGKKLKRNLFIFLAAIFFVFVNKANAACDYSQTASSLYNYQYSSAFCNQYSKTANSVQFSQIISDYFKNLMYVCANSSGIDYNAAKVGVINDPKTNEYDVQGNFGMEWLAGMSYSQESWDFVRNNCVASTPSLPPAPPAAPTASESDTQSSTTQTEEAPVTNSSETVSNNTGNLDFDHQILTDECSNSGGVPFCDASKGYVCDNIKSNGTGVCKIDDGGNCYMAEGYCKTGSKCVEKKCQPDQKVGASDVSSETTLPVSSNPVSTTNPSPSNVSSKSNKLPVALKTPQIPTNTGLATRSINEILNDFMIWLLSIVGILSVIALLISGIQYIMAAGNEEMAESAKKNARYSLIGIVIAMSALIIVRAIDAALRGVAFF